MGLQYANRIQDADPRLHKSGDVGQASGHVLVEGGTLLDHAHVVLHAHAQFRHLVVFDDRHVYDKVAFQYFRINGDALDPIALNLCILEPALVHEN